MVGDHGGRGLRFDVDEGGVKRRDGEDIADRLMAVDAGLDDDKNVQVGQKRPVVNLAAVRVDVRVLPSRIADERDHDRIGRTDAAISTANDAARVAGLLHSVFPRYGAGFADGGKRLNAPRIQFRQAAGQSLCAVLNSKS